MQGVDDYTGKETSLETSNQVTAIWHQDQGSQKHSGRLESSCKEENICFFS